MHFNINDKLIGRSNCCFIIAEIGQNHQGDVELAKEMIKSAKECGADCVKFQKSSLPDKFTKTALERPYNSVNSWGITYGEHKQYLEFSIDQYRELQQYANDLDIIFSASAMDMKSLDQLYSLNLPFIKIGSGDANNYPLLQYASTKTTPLVISTGMQSKRSVQKIVQIMKDGGKTNYCLLHCVSSYPTKCQDVKLRMLDNYRKWFPDVCLGYSGHELGIAISAAAVCLGAKIIERHFTLNKRQKGTDHQLSLLPSELKRLIQTIRNIESNELGIILGTDQIINILKNEQYSPAELEEVEKSLHFIEDNRFLEPCEMDCFNKLGKSLVYTDNLMKGHCLRSKDICVKVSEPNGISAEQYFEFLDKPLVTNVQADQIICLKHF